MVNPDQRANVRERRMRLARTQRDFDDRKLRDSGKTVQSIFSFCAKQSVQPRKRCRERSTTLLNVDHCSDSAISGSEHFLPRLTSQIKPRASPCQSCTGKFFGPLIPYAVSTQIDSSLRQQIDPSLALLYSDDVTPVTERKSRVNAR